MTNHKDITNRRIFSGIITCLALALAYVPIPGLSQKIIVVSGSELAEPLEELETKFEEKYPNINIELKFQGSQDMINNYIDKKNDPLYDQIPYPRVSTNTVFDLPTSIHSH